MDLLQPLAINTLVLPSLCLRLCDAPHSGGSGLLLSPIVIGGASPSNPRPPGSAVQLLRLLGQLQP